MEMLARHEMVFAIGPAGTGKTYLAVAQAVAMLQAGRVDRIVLSRPAVEAGERLGFLPGDLKEKVDPYLRPLYDALHDMMPGDQVIRRMGTGEIEVAPLAFMRGRTLAHAFVILDEAQNTTPVQMKMFLTRMGEGTRMVITGDLSQIDLPPGQRSGLRDALDTLEGLPGIGVSRFGSRDVVRHPLVAAIVDAYDQRAKARSGRDRIPKWTRTVVAAPREEGGWKSSSTKRAGGGWCRGRSRSRAERPRRRRQRDDPACLGRDRPPPERTAPGRNKPTNVLTFESGDIVLALGVVRREARAAAAAPVAPPGPPRRPRRAPPAGPRPRPPRRRPPHGNGGSPAAAPHRRSQPVAGRMTPSRSIAACGTACATWLGGRSSEHNVRDSIAELVQQSAQETPSNGNPPELDRQERVLLANVLRLRGRTADDVMVPRADIVAIPVDLTLEQVLAQIRLRGSLPPAGVPRAVRRHRRHGPHQGRVRLCRPARGSSRSKPSCAAR